MPLDLPTDAPSLLATDLCLEEVSPSLLLVIPFILYFVASLLPTSPAMTNVKTSLFSPGLDTLCQYLPKPFSLLNTPIYSAGLRPKPYIASCALSDQSFYIIHLHGKFFFLVPISLVPDDTNLAPVWDFYGLITCIFLSTHTHRGRAPFCALIPPMTSVQKLLL